MKDKNSKWDLIWIIPEIIGSISIGLAAALHIKHIPSYEIIGLMEWIFQISLVLIVLGLGFKAIGHSTEELKKVFNGMVKNEKTNQKKRS